MENDYTQEKECCNVNNKNNEKKKGFWQGLVYGLIPHIGCLAFIIGSVLGVTVLMQFFKPLLMNRYFFHALVGLSFGLATLSSVLYLRKIGLLSWQGAKRRWKYLSVMYGSTIGINLLLFLVIFPMLANVSRASPTGGAVWEQGLSSLTLSVDIPCSGHAPLISNELKTLKGVSEVKFGFPNRFEVGYDKSLVSKEQILGLAVFEEYPAKIVEEKISGSQNNLRAAETSGGCACGGCQASTY